MVTTLAALGSAILIAASGAGFPGKAPTGEWGVAKGDAFRIASTTNDAGASLGVWCHGDGANCVGFVFTTNSCTEGSTVPMMLNSAVGSAIVTTLCRHLRTDGDRVTTVSVVNDLVPIRSALEGGGSVGIAIPMTNGSFHVLRFSTAGASAALGDVMAAERPPREPRGGNPDAQPAEI